MRDGFGFDLNFLVALHLLGIPITALAFAMGAIAIGVGFGTQNIVNNFISGWILMPSAPLKVQIQRDCYDKLDE